jgi:hypothetical protein
VRLPSEYNRYLILGGNDACYICLDPDRQYKVFSIENIVFERPPQLLNSSVVQMAESFLALREVLSLLTDDSMVDKARNALEAKIAEIDPAALSGDIWWPQVLEQFDFFNGT